FQESWMPAQAPNSSNSESTYALLGKDDGSLVAAMRDSGATSPVFPTLDDLLADPAGPPDVVLLPFSSSDLSYVGTDPVEHTHAATQQLLDVIRRWLDDDRLMRSTLAVVTRRAVAVSADEVVDDLPAAAARGLVRSAGIENPEKFLLIDRDEDPESAQAVLAAALSAGGEVAIRSGRRHVRQLVRRPAHDVEPLRLRPEGTVLITGGTGTLGVLTARHLITEYRIRRVILLGRRERAGVLEDLSDLEADIEVVACDVSDRAGMGRVLEGIPPEHPLSAVIHAAGVNDDATVTAMTDDQLHGVLRPKVDAAWHLHEQTRHLDLDAFVLYSSAAGALGSPGQANYAAANAFLDALAHHRRATGLPATSLAWGPWAETSAMTRDLGDSDHARRARVGVSPLPTGAALSLLDTALSTSEPVLMAIDLDEAVFRARTAPTARSNGRAEAPGGLRQRLSGLSRAEQKRLLLDLVRASAAAVLGHQTADALNPDRSFQDHGFDSLTAVELRNQLATVTGLRLPATLMFDHPTPALLADLLMAEITPAREEAEIRAALASIPLKRLRAAGLIEVLLELAGHAGQEAEPAAQDRAERIRDADLDSLVQMALGDAG
ncbi:MAG TPA: beta-ketoacyl reductase, partial [Nonomuraea sp.]|nr:beta-ketoacyl reductase [Nonomuraea sp.]